VKKRYILFTVLLTIIVIGSIIGIKRITEIDLSKNLLLYYSFDDLKETSIIDKSGNGNNGRKEGTAIVDSLGKIKGSLLLDGQGSVKLPDNIT